MRLELFEDPYHWAWLPMAKNPFSEETVGLVLPSIDSTDFVKELCEDLRKIFKVVMCFCVESLEVPLTFSFHSTALLMLLTKSSSLFNISLNA